MALFKVTVPTENYAGMGSSTALIEVIAEDFIADERGVHFTKDKKYVAYFPRVVSLLRIDT